MRGKLRYTIQHHIARWAHIQPNLIPRKPLHDFGRFRGTDTVLDFVQIKNFQQFAEPSSAPPNSPTCALVSFLRRALWHIRIGRLQARTLLDDYTDPSTEICLILLLRVPISSILGRLHTPAQSQVLGANPSLDTAQLTFQ